MQLNAPSRLRRFVEKAEKAAILNRSVYGSFHMPALVWHFCSFESSRNLKTFNNVALVLNMMTAKVIMKLYQRKGNLWIEIKRLRVLGIEIFKTINNVNPSYMKNIFTTKQMLRFVQMTLQLDIIKILATATRG